MRGAWWNRGHRGEVLRAPRAEYARELLAAVPAV
jgi:hypothetical protein